MPRIDPTGPSLSRAIGWIPALAGCLCSLLLWVPPLAGQTSKEIDHFAEKVAKKAAKSEPRTVLIHSGRGCIGARDTCDALSAALRSRLQILMPGVRFIPAEEAAKHLAEAGFLSVDAYLGAMDNVAYLAGAELSIGEDLARKGDRCDLRILVADAKHLYELADMGAHVPCEEPATRKGLGLLRDPKTGVALIVSAEGAPYPSPIHSPVCVHCVPPHYTGEARSRRLQGRVLILFTVTAQGTVEDVHALGAIDEGLAHATIRAVNAWVFKPATDEDATPFACRMEAEISFTMR